MKLGEQSTKPTVLSISSPHSDNLLQTANHNYLTCDGLDAADEGLHVLLAARLVLVEVGPRRRLVVPRRPLAARRLVTTDLVCCKIPYIINQFIYVSSIFDQYLRVCPWSSGFRSPRAIPCPPSLPWKISRVNKLHRISLLSVTRNAAFRNKSKLQILGGKVETPTK